MTNYGNDFLSRLRGANVRRGREWTDQKFSLSFLGNELAGEVGEACNILKKLDRERMGIRGSRATVEELAEELADIIICVDLIAMEFRLDLEKEIINKFNKTSDQRGLETKL